MSISKQIIFPSLFCLLLGACSQSTNDSKTSIAYGDLVKAQDPLSKATLALVSESPQGLSPYCTAVLIRQDLALTAAHCLDVNAPRVTLAYGLDIKQSPKILHGRSVAHEKYGAPYNENFSFDIGLILLESPAPPDLQPASLAATGDFSVGDSVLLAGYGISSADKDSSSGLIENNTQLYKAEASIKRIFDIDVDEDYSEYGLIVSRSQNNQAQLCPGDSGGPVFVRKAEQLLLAGLTVGGYGKCQTQAYHTNVAFYASWIAEATAKLRAPITTAAFPEFLLQKELPQLFDNDDFKIDYRMLDARTKAVERRFGPLPEVFGDAERSYHIIAITHIETHTQLRAYATFDDRDDGGNTLGWVEDSYGRVVARIDDSFFNPLR